MTVLETLVVLAILAGIAAVALPALRGPPVQLQLRAKAAEVAAMIASARLSAMSTSETQSLEVSKLTCDGGSEPATIILHNDGLVIGPDLCFAIGTDVLRLRPTVLTGRLLPSEAP
jgi:Tfp pilus assembly protein FimT